MDTKFVTVNGALVDPKELEAQGWTPPAEASPLYKSYGVRAERGSEYEGQVNILLRCHDTGVFYKVDGSNGNGISAIDAILGELKTARKALDV